MPIKFTFLFLTVDKIHIFIPKSAYGGGVAAGLGIIPKKQFFSASLILALNVNSGSAHGIAELIQI